MDTNKDDNKAKLQQFVATAIAKMERDRSSTFRTMFMTPAGLSRQLLSVAVNTVFLGFLMPWVLPGVNFYGSLGDAVMTALVPIALGLVISPVMRLFFMDILRAMANGGGWAAFGVMMGASFALVFVELWVMTVWPGALVLSGIHGYILAFIGFAFATHVHGKLAKQLCPAYPES